jgi:hypothetical protein
MQYIGSIPLWLFALLVIAVCRCHALPGAISGAVTLVFWRLPMKAQSELVNITFWCLLWCYQSHAQFGRGVTSAIDLSIYILTYIMLGWKGRLMVVGLAGLLTRPWL